MAAGRAISQMPMSAISAAMVMKNAAVGQVQAIQEKSRSCRSSASLPKWKRC
jgi:hypothetical protein